MNRIRAVGSGARLVEQALPTRGSDVRKVLPFHAIESRYGRMTLATRHIFA